MPDNRLAAGDILNYALTLEHLEDTFYRQGLANYTHQDFVDAGFEDPFYDNVRKIASDEMMHVKFITEALTGMSLFSLCFEPSIG